MAKNKLPILITIPHASLFVPADLRKNMNLVEKEIKEHADLATDEIFDVPNAYVIKADIHRLVVDPNRAPDDIEMEIKLASEGVVVAISEGGKTIYHTPPTVEQIAQRVERYHEKFHKKIEQITPKVKFMIDGHSMKSIGPLNKPDAGKPRADIILGNRDYTTCSRQITLKIKDFFENKGYSVSVNTPYKGKYVIGYHASRKDLPGIQVEVNRKLYMNEKTLAIYPKKIAQLNSIMSELVEVISEEIDKSEKVY